MSYCTCGHAAQLHAPGGVLADTDERGYGPCTAGPHGYECLCDGYCERAA